VCDQIADHVCDQVSDLVTWLRLAVRFDGWVFGVKLSDEDIADFEVLKDVAIVTVFGFQYMGCTLTPPGKYG